MKSRIGFGKMSKQSTRELHPLLPENFQTCLQTCKTFPLPTRPQSAYGLADCRDCCAATWKGMARADKAMTTYKAFLSSCREIAPKEMVAVRPDQRLAPLPCHDYSDCTTQEVISDPK